jgi:hypothetical protein
VEELRRGDGEKMEKRERMSGDLEDMKVMYR